MISAVFDTNIILQGILSSNGPAGACVAFVSNKLVQLVSTEKIISEINMVVSRPKMIAKYGQLQGEQPAKVLHKIRTLALMAQHPPQIYEFSRDPTDEVFINLALANNVDCLVSRDQDLLDLTKDSDFVSKFSALNIVTPVGFLEIVRAT